jgi:hypothetical protein
MESFLPIMCNLTIIFIFYPNYLLEMSVSTPYFMTYNPFRCFSDQKGQRLAFQN